MGTVLVLRMAHRKWKETMQQPSMLPGPAVPGCSLVSFHFMWAILCPQTVTYLNLMCINASYFKRPYQLVLPTAYVMSPCMVIILTLYQMVQDSSGLSLQHRKTKADMIVCTAEHVLTYSRYRLVRYRIRREIGYRVGFSMVPISLV